MKKAVMYGAGNIGRGFIGQLFSQSGYEVIFVDVNQELIDKLNKDHCYPIDIVSDQETEEIIIKNVCGINARDIESVAEAIGDADIMATAVGANILPFIAEPIAKGLKRRWEQNHMMPFNIIICENLLDANHYLEELIMGKLITEEDKSSFKKLIGLIKASVGRMVPVMTEEMQKGNIARICVEPYDKLPVDREGFKGEIPDIKNIIPYSPFDYYIKRKLFIHNMGHAIIAYLGELKDYTYIWEAVADPWARKKAMDAMLESAKAISEEYKGTYEELKEHVEDLLFRFGNRQLRDTVERVGRDLKRKLSPNDRMIGALRLCEEYKVPVNAMSYGIAAALMFNDSVDSPVKEMIDEDKYEDVLTQHCMIEKGSDLYNQIIKAYKELSHIK